MTWRRYVAALRLLLETALNAAVYGALLFGPAGTVLWWRGWVLVGATFIGMLITRLWVFRANPALLEERRKAPIQAGQPLADRVLVVAFMLVYPAYIAFIALDVFRYQLIAPPVPLVSVAGLLAAGAGWWLVTLALHENAFAAAIVKHQSERAQTVVATGVYAVVRHPLYAGVVLITVGVPLWLQSYAGALASIVPSAVVALRIVVEERFLGERLPGYDAYMLRVRRRLVPFVW